MLLSPHLFGLCSLRRPDLAPVYLTLSPLYREATNSTRLIEREVQVHWENGSVDSITLYNTDPKAPRSGAPMEKALELKTVAHPDGFLETNIPFGDPKFPGGWERDSEEDAVSGEHCLPMWLVAHKDNEVVHTDCIKIRPTWMQDNRLSLENLELTSLFIPGTHNSGSYRRAETTGPRDTSGRYIITQDQTLWQQLVYGVRYLDLRIGYYSQRKNGSEATEDDNSFWINHDLIKVRKLIPLLDDIKLFLKKTKEEIIILDLHRFPLGFTGRSSRHQQLVKLLERELKEYALPYKKDYNPTLGSIWDQGKRIIISYGDNTVARAMKFLLTCMALLSLSWGHNLDDTEFGNNQNSPNSSVPTSSCNCGWRNDGRIVGGRETLPNEYPWKVIIICLTYLCGGSIITEFHILTAAHCTHGLEPKQMKAIVGRHNISDTTDGVEHAIAKYMEHKDYETDPLTNDIAILVTVLEIMFNPKVGPVCFPRERVNLDGQELTVMGWGLTDEKAYGTILQAVELSYISLEECKAKWNDSLPKNDKVLCAYEEDKDSCNGDSGGGLVFHNPFNSRYTLVALVSYGDPNCGSEIPSVNTDVYAYKDWIHDNIQETKQGMVLCMG